MNDTLFIPPCCVDKKLPRAIIQAPRRALSFYTHGDVHFNSIKVRLELINLPRKYPHPFEFQFHKGAIRTQY